MTPCRPRIQHTSTPSIVLIFMGLGAIGLLFGLPLLAYLLLVRAGSGSAGTTPSQAAPTVKLRSRDALSTFIELCGKDTMVCRFVPATALIINAECDCASHHIILNAATTKKIIDGAMSTPRNSVLPPMTKN